MLLASALSALDAMADDFREKAISEEGQKGEVWRLKLSLQGSGGEATQMVLRTTRQMNSDDRSGK
jgi:hypothetical protein